MKMFSVFVVVLALLTVCLSAQGATIYKITFDHGVQFGGVADYTAGANEILPAGVHGVLLSLGEYPDSNHRSGNLINPVPAGFQGGQSLNMMIGGAWANKQGYYFGRDFVASGDNYDQSTYPASGCPAPIGSAGSVIENEYTIEMVVKPDFTPSPQGQTNVSTIFDSIRSDAQGGAGIAVDQTTGIVTYNSGAPTGSITSTTALQPDTWYHIAVVVRPMPFNGAPQRTELWINGALDGVGAYPDGWQTQGLFKLPGYFTIGTAYWPMDGRNWQGQIDAVAISDKALDAGTFVFTSATIEMPEASTVYKITFDRGPLPYGPLDYVAGHNEVLPPNVHGVALCFGQYPDETRRIGNIIDPLVPGPQGGQAFNMMLAGSWPNKQGYFFGRDPVVNGTNYGNNTYPTYAPASLQIGDPGPVIANEYTIEAVVRPDYSTNPGLNFGLTNVSPIYSSVRYDDIPGGAELVVDQVWGSLYFNAHGSGGIGDIYANTLLEAGNWYHIAAVVRPVPDAPENQRTELWINGVLDETGGYPAGWETQDIFTLPGYFTIGTQYWPMAGRSWQGQIDAFAISSKALDPTSFVLIPTVTVTPIADIKQLDDLESVTCRGTVTAVFESFFYIEDPSRCSGIRVAKDFFEPVVGNTAVVSGMMGTLPWGERQILAESVSELPGAAVGPVAMNNKTLGGAGGVVDGVGVNNIGLLVKTTGKVSNSAAGTFDLDDGSGVPVRAVLLPEMTPPADDSYVIVTGISSAELIGQQSERLILVTSYEDANEIVVN